MSQTPKVIGFVPAYKAEKFILKTLEALGNQTYPNFEILICDDVSPDQTADVCREFCRRDSRFRFIRNSENLGWFKTSEKLWLEAAGESKYCFTNPHDDLLYPDYISALVQLLEENPTASLAIPGMENEYLDKTLFSFYKDASEIEDTVAASELPKKTNTTDGPHTMASIEAKSSKRSFPSTSSRLVKLNFRSTLLSC